MRNNPRSKPPKGKDSRYKDRVVLVTGGGRGIGRAIADRFADEGFVLILSDQNGQSANLAAKAIIDQTGAEVISVTCDVSQEDQVGRLYADIRARFGRLDVLVNNAGISIRIGGKKATVEETPLDVWRKTLDVNLTGVFLMCRGALPLLKKSAHGRIINISSMAARMRTNFTSNYYAASKAGILGFSRVLAGEAAPFGITVNCVTPTRIETEMAQTHSNLADVEKAYLQAIPLGRMGRPDDVANVVAFLASDEASFLTGATIDVSGGQFMP